MSKRKRLIARIFYWSLLAIPIVSCSHDENIKPGQKELVFPKLETFQITDVNLFSVKAGCRIIDDGGLTIEEVGLVAGTSPGPTVDDNINKFILDADDNGEFRSIITSFDASTTYYIRSYAINKDGVGYGNEVQFTSPDEKIYTDNGGQVTLTNQEQVNEFGSHQYTTVTDLVISGDVTDLTPLSSIVIVNSNLTIKYTKLQSLKGLNNLRVSGYIFPNSVRIEHNASLETLEGLNNFQYSRGYFYILENDKLTNLQGLNNYLMTSGDFNISGCDALTSLSGLEKLQVIHGHFYVRKNPQLEDLTALKNLTFIGGWINVVSNPSLVDLHGLERVNAITGGISVLENTGLLSLEGLDGIESAPEGISLKDNEKLTDISALQRLDSIGGLYVVRNKSLVKLDGLHNLLFLGYGGEISQNTSLADFCPLRLLFTRSKTKVRIFGNLHNPSMSDVLLECD